MNHTFTPDQYKQTRESLKLTRRQLANMLRVDIRTVERRELGQIKLTFEACIAISYLCIAANELLKDPTTAKMFAAIK